MSYRLKDDGYPFLKIMHGKNWIGRVYKNAQGLWVCQINKKSYYEGRTPEEAFDEGVSRYMGYSSAAALRTQNRQARERKNARRQQAGSAARKYFNPASTPQNRWDALDQIVDAVFPKPTEKTNV